MKLAGVHHKTNVEPVWHVQMAVVAAVVLQLLLSSSLTVVPKYGLAVVEGLLLVILMITPRSGRTLYSLKRSAALLLIVIISIANLLSLVLVVQSLLVGSAHLSGRELIASGFAIYLTNIIVFGLWYWELDGNGVQGQPTDVLPVDFLFPQMTPGEHVLKHGKWAPSFFDYLYISVVNAMAFSPSDTYPLTHRAKALMSIQALVSIITVALVAARAVSILS